MELGLNINLIDIILLVVDLILAFIIYSKIKKSTKNFEMFKFKKMIFTLSFLIVIFYHLGLGGVSILLAIVLGIYPIITLIAYPQTFRNFLDDYQTRKVSKQNVNRMISDKNIGNLADAIINNYNQKLGSLYVITRQDLLSDIESNGYDMGETNISKDLLELFFKPNSPLGLGAVVIRDNKIVSTNSRLPYVSNELLKQQGATEKQFGMLGVSLTSDAVVIGTNGESGFITIGGTRPQGNSYFRLNAKLQVHDVQNGLTRDEIISTIKILMSGVGNPEDFHREQQLEQEKQEKLEQKAQDKLNRAKNIKSKEQKIQERNEKRNKKK